MPRRLVAIGLVLAAMASDGRAATAALPLPRPGTYVLNRIQRVPFALVLEGNRVPRPLSRYTTDAITLLSFFYTSCGDPQGCPLAWEAFEKVRGMIKARQDLHGRIRLVFMSLDPRRDTPQMLQVLARPYSEDAAIVPWHFLTTYGPAFLEPLLRDLGAEASIDRDASAGGAVVLNHMLKVFLVDRTGWVREIYSNTTLDPEAILGDIETLLLEDNQRAG